MKLSLAAALIWCFRGSYSKFVNEVKTRDGERELLANYDEDGYKFDDKETLLEEIESDLDELDYLVANGDTLDIKLMEEEDNVDDVVTIQGYEGHSTGGCNGRNELGKDKNVASVQLCARKCDDEPDCVSFEYKKMGTTCLLSSTCNDFSMTNQRGDDAGFYWYLKLTPAAPVTSEPTTSEPTTSEPTTSAPTDGNNLYDGTSVNIRFDNEDNGKKYLSGCRQGGSRTKLRKVGEGKETIDKPWYHFTVKRESLEEQSKCIEYGEFVILHNDFQIRGKTLQLTGGRGYRKHGKGEFNKLVDTRNMSSEPPKRKNYQWQFFSPTGKTGCVKEGELLFMKVNYNDKDVEGNPSKDKLDKYLGYRQPKYDNVYTYHEYTPPSDFMDKLGWRLEF